MEDSFQQIDQQDDIGRVFLIVRDFARAEGVKRQSYHFTPVFESPTSENTVVFADGFSQEWLALYSSRDFRKHDPIPERTLRAGKALSWEKAMQLEPNTSGQEQYFVAMREYDLKHGVGLPLYGPNSRDAYASYDFGRPIEGDLAARFNRIKAVAQAGQLKVCTLLAEEKPVPTLSDREREVLYWMAQAKSTGDIGTIIGVSPETVKTYMKRIYDKLEVQNRIGAIIRGLRLKLIWRDLPSA